MVIGELGEQFVGEQNSDLLILDGSIRLLQRHFDIVRIDADAELALGSAVEVALRVGSVFASRSKLRDPVEGR